MTYTLVLYFVLQGHMQTARLKMPDEATCQSHLTQASEVSRPGLMVLHAECKEKKPSVRGGRAPKAKVAT
jgi:hypothetical protein